MDWKDVANTIGKGAPLIGGLLGGPLGAAGGGIVAKLVSSALGCENTPESVQSAIAADPAALEKLQEVESNNKVAIQQLAVTAENNRMLAENAQYAAEAADRASARDLAAKTPKDWLRPTVALMIITSTIGIVYSVMLGFANGALKDVTIAATAGALLMYFLKEADKVTSFLFGTTKKADEANESIRNFAVSPGTVTQDDKQ